MSNPLFFDHLPTRSAKPRQTGVTMVRDDGHPLPELRAILSTYGRLIDYVKFRQVLTWYLDFDELRAKIAACTAADVKTFVGGTVLEAAHLHGKTSEALATMKEIGLTAVEVSASVVPLELDQLATVVKMSADQGFEVLYEYGKKFQKSSFDVDEAADDIKSLLEAGASRIIVERWQLTAALGDHGELETAGRVVELADRVGLEHLVFEAESNEHQVWLIAHLGPEVNLGPNIEPFLVPSKLEPWRNGFGSEANYAAFPRMMEELGTVVSDLLRPSATSRGEVMRVRAVMMRGGTSKGLFLHEDDLPTDPRRQDAFLLAAYGSPDRYRRQVDGVGGATSVTSKVAIVGDGAAFDADVTYTFGQVSIDTALVDRRGTCGNMSAGIGPFAVEAGLVAAVEPMTKVRIFNTNTKKHIVSHVPVRDGHFDPEGTFEVPGVPNPGAAIRLDYLDPAGAVTGRLLPTGNPRDRVHVPGVGEIEISIVDAANPLAFVRWSDLGLTGVETPQQIDADPELLARIEAVRRAASVAAHITPTLQEAALVPAVPKLTFVGEPLRYLPPGGDEIEPSQASVRVGMMSMGRAHGSIALTGAICTVVAAGITGTLVQGALAPSVRGVVHIEHNAGLMTLEAHPTYDDVLGWSVDAVSVFRTARCLFEGHVLVSDERVERLMTELVSV